MGGGIFSGITSHKLETNEALGYTISMGIEDAPKNPHEVTRAQTPHTQEEPARAREKFQALHPTVQDILRRAGQRFPRTSLALFDGDLFPSRDAVNNRKGK